MDKVMGKNGYSQVNMNHFETKVDTFLKLCEQFGQIFGLLSPKNHEFTLTFIELTMNQTS